MVGRLAFVFLALGAPSAALAAQEGSPAQVNAVISCIDIPAVEERVRCYDRSAVVLRDSLRSGQVAVVSGSEQRRREPTASRIDATITSATVTPSGGWRLQLSNGQVWQTYERQRRTPPPVGTAVRISRNLIGSTFISVRSYPQARVFRVDE